MKRNFTATFLAALLLLANASTAQSDYATIINNITAALKKNVSGVSIGSTASTYMTTQNADGSWPDLSYVSGVAGDGPFGTHLTRLYQYSQAYTISTSPLYGDAALYNHLSLALQYWNNNIHDAYNWWNDQIGYPQLLGQTLVLMRGGNQPL